MSEQKETPASAGGEDAEPPAPEAVETIEDAAMAAEVAEAASEAAAEAAAEAEEEAEDLEGPEPVELVGPTLEDQLLRALAETENVRRRAAREREDTAKFAVSDFARDLLSVVDNFRRALDNMPDGAREDGTFSGVVSGVEMIERDLLSVLERHGIHQINPLGEKFDHNFHQAVIELDSNDKPAGTVIQVMQAGYVISGRLLRPAMVGVAKATKPTEPVEHVDTEA